MSSNKWIYILGIFCKYKFLVSKDCGSLDKNKRIIKREISNSFKLNARFHVVIERGHKYEYRAYGP
jgi:hypothetical protein